MASTRASRGSGAWAKSHAPAAAPRSRRLRLRTPSRSRAQGRVTEPKAPLPEQPVPAGPRLSPWVWGTGLVLCLLGLADATYLTVAHYTTARILACSGTGVIDCAKVTTSAQSVIFGIPVAVLGLAYFAGMLPLLLPVAWRTTARWVRYLRLAGVITGIGMVAYLVYTELFTLRAICLYCTGVHVVTLLLFLTVMAGTALAPHPGDDA